MQGSFGKYFGPLFLCLRAFPFSLLEAAIYIFGYISSILRFDVGLFGTVWYNLIWYSLLQLPPYHHQTDQKISRIPRHPRHKLSSSGTTLLTKTKTTPPPHLTPNVIYEISCYDGTAAYN